MKSLTCTQKLWLLSRYVNWSFHVESGIRKQDCGNIFKLITENNYGRDLAYQFLRENFKLVFS